MDKKSSVNYLNFSLRRDQLGLIKTPLSTTLANFVGSVLSHSLNTVYAIRYARPNIPSGHFVCAEDVIRNPP